MFGPQNLVGVPMGTEGGTWCHREACIEAKKSHEEPVVIGWMDLEFDHFAPWLSGSVKISKGISGIV